LEQISSKTTAALQDLAFVRQLLLSSAAPEKIYARNQPKAGGAAKEPSAPFRLAAQGTKRELLGGY
jgi:hypothetical protein